MPPEIKEVKFVQSGEDYKVKIVESGEDFQAVPVQFGEQMKVRIVESGEDYKVKVIRDPTAGVQEDDDMMSSCFITTACIEAKGLPDDCLELTTMRAFRDNYVKSLPRGGEILCQYYKVAPQIVAGINGRENRRQIYQTLYDQIATDVGLIRQRKNQEALSNLLSLFNELKEKYLKWEE